MGKQQNEKYNSFGLVIDPQKESANPYYELAQLQETLLGCKDFFVATIIHDKDKDKNNYPKITHLHAYIEPKTKMTKKQCLETFSALLSIDPLRISVDPTNNGYLLVQYLTHKNDQDKTQYSIDLVKTNNTDLLTLKYNEIYVSPTERQEQLKRDIFECKTLSQLVNKQGLENTKKFQTIFNQIKREQGLDLDRFANIIDRLEFFIDWLEEHKRVIKSSEEINEEQLKELLLIYGEIKVRFSEFFKYKN